MTDLTRRSTVPSVNDGRVLDSEGETFVVRIHWTDVSALVPEIKKLPGRRFDMDRKLWIVPASAVADVAVFARDHKFTVTPSAMDLGRAARKTQNSSTALTTDFSVEGLGAELMPFQRAGVEYALRVRRTFIGDDVGLGKTAQALATIHVAKAYPAVVVVKAVSTNDWIREIKLWTPDVSAEILYGETAMKSSADIVIVGWPVLKYHLDELLSRNPKAVVFDESHYGKSPKAQRTKAALKLRNAVPADGFILNLTATAQKNRPIELAAQLDLLKQLDAFGGFWSFAKRYCAAHQIQVGRRKFWDFSGSSNLVELNERLKATCLIRRKKTDVLPELPAVRTAPVELEIDNESEYRKAEASVIDYLADIDIDKASAAEMAEALVQINVLRQLAAKGKMAAMTDWITEFLETGEKLIVFGWHQNVVKTLAETFKAPGITGSTSKKLFDAEVDKFQTDPKAQLLIVNMQTGGEAKTMTAASNVAFAEFGWNRATHDQAIGRAYGRLNDAHGVTAWYLKAIGTIDESMLDLAEAKGRSSDASMDGEVAKREESVLRELIEQLQSKKKGKVA